MFRLSMCKREAAEVAACEHEAFTAYLREHYTGTQPDQFAATEITSVITEKVRLPGGRIQVLISVINRKPWECDTFFYVLQINGRKISRRTLKSQPKR